MAAPASSFEAVQVPEAKVQYPSYDSKPIPKSEAEFLQRAREVAELLAGDVADVRKELYSKEFTLIFDLTHRTLYFPFQTARP